MQLMCIPTSLRSRWHAFEVYTSYPTANTDHREILAQDNI